MNPYRRKPQLPDHPVITRFLEVRISDNVLEAADWPVRRLAFNGSVVAAVYDVHLGVYTWDHGPGVGWDIERVATWAQYDSTSSHPEVYHDVKVEGRWSAWTPAFAIRKELDHQVEAPECSICRRRHGPEVTHACE